MSVMAVACGFLTGVFIWLTTTALGVTGTITWALLSCGIVTSIVTKKETCKITGRR